MGCRVAYGLHYEWRTRCNSGLRAAKGCISGLRAAPVAYWPGGEDEWVTGLRAASVACRLLFQELLLSVRPAGFLRQ